MNLFLRSLMILTIISFYAHTNGNSQGFLSETRADGKKRVIMPVVYYSNPDRFFAGIKWRFMQARLKDDPTGIEQSIQLRYSISQNAFSLRYDGRFKQLFGNWDFNINGYYDWVIWTNYNGLGNETVQTNSQSYYQLSTSEYAGYAGVSRMFGEYHQVGVNAFVQGIEVLNKPASFVGDSIVNNRNFYFEHHMYTGLSAGYTYQKVDDPITPQKGAMFYLGARYTVNIDQTDKSFLRGDGIAQVYIPLFSKFSLSLRAGAATVSGTPEFYQYVSVCGPVSVRGYIRDRYWGNTMFYNSNELRYITDFHLIRGKIGFLALFDGGRVWVENEKSNVYHTAYGGGLILAPLNKISGSVTYARSPDAGRVQVRISHLLTRDRQPQVTGKQWK